MLFSLYTSEPSALLEILFLAKCTIWIHVLLTRSLSHLIDSSGNVCDCPTCHIERPTARGTARANFQHPAINSRPQSAIYERYYNYSFAPAGTVLV